MMNAPARYFHFLLIKKIESQVVWGFDLFWKYQIIWSEKVEFGTMDTVELRRLSSKFVSAGSQVIFRSLYSEFLDRSAQPKIVK